MERALGQPHWVWQLNRPLFSIFLAVYDFVKLLPRDEVRPLPPAVCGELALSVVTFLWTELDLRRQWAPSFFATDATPSYGFGVCRADATPEEVESVAGHLGHCVDVHVRPAASAEERKKEIPREGRLVRLPVYKRKFKVLISAKAAYKAHAGTMEAEGQDLLWRWMSRAPKFHSTRAVVLQDAQAVRSATTKGRSSAPSLFRPLRRGAAYRVAADVEALLPYCPSESMPADGPSRGRPVE